MCFSQIIEKRMLDQLQFQTLFNDFFHGKSTVNTLSSKGVDPLQLSRGHEAEQNFDEELMRKSWLTLNAHTYLFFLHVTLISAEDGLYNLLFCKLVRELDSWGKKHCFFSCALSRLQLSALWLAFFLKLLSYLCFRLSFFSTEHLLTQICPSQSKTQIVRQLHTCPGIQVVRKIVRRN